MSLLRLQSRITFYPMDPTANILNWKQDPNRQVLEFLDLIHDVSVKTSFKNLADNAKIIIPRKLISQLQGGTIVNEPLISGLNAIIQRGDKVKIELGYFTTGFNGLRNIFEGYVTRLIPNVPLVVECQDTMFAVQSIKFTFPPNSQLQLVTQSDKGKPLKKPYLTPGKEYDLTTLLSNLLDPYGIPWINLAGGVSMGKILWTDINGAQVLDGIRNGSTTGYCLYSYFVSAEIANYIINNIIPNNPTMTTGCALTGTPATGPVLLVGFQDNVFAGNLNTNGTPEIFTFEYNIIQNNLLYQNEREIDLTIIAHSIQKKDHNNQLKYTYPEGSNGTKHDIYCANNATLADLKLAATTSYLNWAYTGFRGNFTTFGEPFVVIGDKITLTSSVYPEKYGTYQVVSVNRDFGPNGYRQEIELGQQTNFNKYDGANYNSSNQFNNPNPNPPI